MCRHSRKSKGCWRFWRGSVRPEPVLRQPHSRDHHVRAGDPLLLNVRHRRIRRKFGPRESACVGHGIAPAPPPGSPKELPPIPRELQDLVAISRAAVHTRTFVSTRPPVDARSDPIRDPPQLDTPAPKCLLLLRSCSRSEGAGTVQRSSIEKRSTSPTSAMKAPGSDVQPTSSPYPSATRRSSRRAGSTRRRWDREKRSDPAGRASIACCPEARTSACPYPQPVPHCGLQRCRSHR